MLIVEIVLAAVVVFGVAVVAMGYGGSITHFTPDWPGHRLPEGRTLRADDIAAARFSLAVRGYRMSEVDEALDRLALEIAERDARIEQLTGRPYEAPERPADGYPPAAASSEHGAEQRSGGGHADADHPDADHPDADHPDADHPNADHWADGSPDADHPDAGHQVGDYPTAEFPAPGREHPEESAFAGNPSAPSPYAQSSYGQPSYEQPSYEQPSHAANPYGDNPYGANPYSANPYSDNPYSDKPYSDKPHPDNPYAPPRQSPPEPFEPDGR